MTFKILILSASVLITDASVILATFVLRKCLRQRSNTYKIIPGVANLHILCMGVLMVGFFFCVCHLFLCMHEFIHTKDKRVSNISFQTHHTYTYTHTHNDKSTHITCVACHQSIAIKTHPKTKCV